MLYIKLSYPERTYEESGLKAELHEILYFRSTKKRRIYTDSKKKKTRELARKPKERGRCSRHKIRKHLINEMVRWASCCERSSKIRTRKIPFRCDRCSLVNKLLR